MARSMRKTTLREIKHTFGRYMAILAIIALGVGFFSGVRDTTPAMVNMMNGFLEENNFYDFRIISTSGWNDKSVEEFAEQPDVLMAEGSISFDASYYVPSRSIDEAVLKTHMLPEKINTIKVIEGTLPENSEECAVEQGRGYKIGFFVYYKITASLTGLYISFVAQNGVGVFNCNNAYIAFFRHHSFAWQLAAKRKSAVYNVIS